MKVDLVVENCSLATMDGPQYGAVEDGAGGGSRRAHRLGGCARATRPASTAADRIDGGGGWLTPGLIDCHTHLVHGGNRAAEFEMRLQGASYEEIARAGGGILVDGQGHPAGQRGATARVGARAACRRSPQEGVTTVEIKSGYGLDTANELKMLRVARRLGEDQADAIRVVTTLLAAHALPPEYAGRADAYIDEVCDVDDPRGGSRRTGRCGRRLLRGHRLLACAVRAGASRRRRRCGLPVKLHADQLSNLGGAALVARHGGLSADHIEYADEAGVAALAAAGTVAVLLPGAFYFLRETQLPPVDGPAPPRRAHGARHRLQPRLLAAALAAAGHEHGLHAVPADAGRGACRLHRQCRRGPRAWAVRSAASCRACGRSSPSGTSSGRPNSPT